MIEDRRGDSDRRTGKSRRSDPEIASRPEADKERRTGQRRRVIDRRFSASPFEPEKAELIRLKIARTGTLGKCPLCNSALSLGEPVVTSTGPLREVRCDACWRSVAVALL